MNKLLMVLAWMAATVMVSGQGTLDVRNKAYGVKGSVDALIFDVDGVTKLAGAAYLAQVYAGPAENLAPVGGPYPFRTGTGVGYYDWGTVVVHVNTVAPGATASIQVVAWEAAAGSYADASAPGSGYKAGASTVFTAVLGNAGVPPALPVIMYGLTSFSLGLGLNAIPEPSSMALGLLGAIILLRRRHK